MSQLESWLIFFNVMRKDCFASFVFIYSKKFILC